MSKSMLPPACAISWIRRSCVPLPSTNWLWTRWRTIGDRGGHAMAAVPIPIAVQPPALPIEPFGASKKARFVSTKPCALITSGPKRMLPRSFRTRTVPIGLMIVPSRITFDAAIAPGWRLRIWITVAGKRCWMSNSIVARFGGNSDERDVVRRAVRRARDVLDRDGDRRDRIRRVLDLDVMRDERAARGVHDRDRVPRVLDDEHAVVAPDVADRRRAEVHVVVIVRCEEARETREVVRREVRDPGAAVDEVADLDDPAHRERAPEEVGVAELVGERRVDELRHGSVRVDGDLGVRRGREVHRRLPVDVAAEVRRRR